MNRMLSAVICVAACSMTVLGCDSEEDASLTGAERQIIMDSCVQQEECSSAFYATYTDVQDCADSNAEAAEGFLDSEGRGCVDALIEYEQCRVDEFTCDDYPIIDMLSTVCSTAAQEFTDRCISF